MKQDAKALAAVLSAVLLGLLVVGYRHSRAQRQVAENYLSSNRPDVVVAIEAFKAAHGRYPDSITNAVPRYYKGPQRTFHFLERYEYQNLETNFYLKHF